MQLLIFYESINWNLLADSSILTVFTQLFMFLPVLSTTDSKITVIYVGTRIFLVKPARSYLSPAKKKKKVRYLASLVLAKKPERCKMTRKRTKLCAQAFLLVGSHAPLRGAEHRRRGSGGILPALTLHSVQSFQPYILEYALISRFKNVYLQKKQHVEEFEPCVEPRV